ncbi:MAG: exopolysaccharide biosynthesis polyprenyl glycosylphosphotransferase [Wujia sp.]
MYSKEQKKRLLNIITNCFIWIFETLSFGAVWYNFYYYEEYVTKVPVVIIMYSIFVYLITKSFNGYKISYMRTMDLALSHIIAILCSDVVGYIFISMIWHKNEDPLPMVVLVFAQSFFAVAWVWFVRHVYMHVYPPRKVIIIYGNYPADSFIRKLNIRSETYTVCEILNYQKGMDRICNDVLDFEGVFLYDLPAEDRNVIMKYCYRNSIRTYVVPKITDIILEGSEDLHLVDTPIYLSRNIGLSVDQRFVKRTMDIIVSSIGIVITAPIMLIIALMIKLYDGGPVFYRQERLTRDGKAFNIFKFRSMRTDAEKEGAQLAQKHDSRVTPVGKVLRNLHVDELPQLFNIFIGDMSLVGPRPERPEIFEKYKESIPDFDFRLKVKAGLTGYAQVYGKYNTTPIDKLKLDLTYIQEYSYWLDIKLMLLTFRIVFRKESSEGVEDNQTTALTETDRRK